MEKARRAAIKRMKRRLMAWDYSTFGGDKKARTNRSVFSVFGRRGDRFPIDPSIFTRSFPCNILILYVKELSDNEIFFS